VGGIAVSVGFDKFPLFVFSCLLSFWRSSMSTYKIRLIAPDGEEIVIEAEDDAYLLDSAEMLELSCPLAAGRALARHAQVK
jgi:hypothetical protein